MNEIVDARNWLHEIVNSSQQHLNYQDIPWLKEVRSAAQQEIDTILIPQRKQEIWRYSNVQKIFKEQFKPSQEFYSTFNKEQLKPYLTDLECYRIVLVNGQFNKDMSTMENLPEGVTLTTLVNAFTSEPEFLTTWFDHNAKNNDHIFSVLNTALVNNGIFLRIATQVKLEKPIEIIFVNDTDTNNLIIQPRNLIVLEENASATIIERYIGTENSIYFNNSLNEMLLDKQSTLNHYRVQEESRKAFHLGNLFLKQNEASQYNHISIALGGEWARTEFHVNFSGENAHCKLDGISVVSDKQMMDYHLDIRHDVPNCNSSENFKNLLLGKGKAVFDGMIYVAKDAQKTDAHLSNANLLLSRQAEVDTKPQLEIYADDVQCSHGTSIGQLEPQQIYYLRTRGLDEQSAKKLLCSGFIAEITNQLTIENLSHYINQIVDEKLNH